jgi:hypothetical protein
MNTRISSTAAECTAIGACEDKVEDLSGPAVRSSGTLIQVGPARLTCSQGSTGGSFMQNWLQHLCLSCECLGVCEDSDRYINALTHYYCN